MRCTFAKLLATSLAIPALMLGSVAFAQNSEITIGTDSGPVNSDVDVPVSLDANNHDIANIDFDIAYDDTELELRAGGDACGFVDIGPATNANGHSLNCTDLGGGVLRVLIDPPATFPIPLLAEGELFSIRFSILGSATVGAATPVTYDNLEASNDTGSNVDPGNITANEGEVQVVDASAILDVQPANINFPATENGSSSTAQSFTISNDGTDSIDLEVTDVSLATGTHFSVSANSCAATPFTLADGESCTYDAVFSPTAIGNFNDTVTVTSDAGQVTNDQVALSGEGTAGPAATLEVAPASHDFGDVLTGDSTTFTFTVSNSGDAGSSLDIDAIGLGGGADFSISGGTCSVGDTLGDGDSCTVAVDFAPAADGAQSDTLTVDGTDTVNSTSVSDSAALDGNGVSEARFTSDPAPGPVNMGLTPPGGTLNQTVTVTNEGNENLTVGSCAETDPDDLFTFTPAAGSISMNVAPDASDSFAVSCDVPAPGSFSASLSCDTNDPNNATVTYNFTCNGQILEIPTMQPWGLVLLTMLMLMIGGLSIRYFRA